MYLLAIIFLTGSQTYAQSNPPVTPTPQPTWWESWIPTDPEEVRKALFGAVIALIGALVVIYFQKIVTAMGSFFEWVWTRFRVEHAIENTYRKKLASELRSIQLLTMPEAKDLETFYIPLRIVRWMEPELRAKNSTQNDQPIYLHEALERFQRIAIVGNPGAGKTTITSHAAATMADQKLRINDKEYFPVYIQLRRLREFLESESYSQKSLLDLAREHLDRYKFPDSGGLLGRRLQNGTCLLVLDGFDELADREALLQQRLANKVRDFIDGIHADNRIILTSRSAGYTPAWFQGFNVLEMSELSLDQTKQFIEGWFGYVQGDKSQALSKVLDENHRLQMLVTNPLMLAIVCFVYGTKKPSDNFLPQRRADLYDRCIEALIVEWDRSRSVNRDPLFTPEEIETVLQFVAYDALLQETIDFTSKELEALVRTYMNEAGLRQYKSEDFLKEVLEHTGLFKEKGENKVGFIHQTFQEYLAAKVIERNVLDGVKIKDVRAKIGDVLRHSINPAWAEPIALAAGIMRGRTELVDELYAYYQRQPGPELEMLLALCLRDADLDNFEFDPQHLQQRDEILSNTVNLALEGAD